MLFLRAKTSLPPYSTEWLIRSYLGGNSTYFTWEILRAVCQTSSLYLELFWRMLLCNTTVIVKRSPRCISKLEALSDDKWVISCLLIWGLSVPACVWVWSWLLSVIMAGFRIACSHLDLQHPEEILHRGIPTLETAKKGWRSTGGPAVCVAWWKLQGQGGTVIIWQSSKRSSGRKWTKMWRGSTLAGMMLLWAGKGFLLTLTLLQPPCVVNHDASTVSVGIRKKKKYLHPCSQRNKSLNIFTEGSSRKRALLDLTSEEGGFGAEILLPCTASP